MKYRLDYEYTFVVAGGSAQIKDDIIRFLSLFLEFYIFKDGKEVLFENNFKGKICEIKASEMEQKLSLTNYLSVPLNTLIKVIYDANTKKGYRILTTPAMEFAKSLGYDIKYRPSGYFKDYIDYDGDNRMDLINKKEFERILKTYPNLFNHLDNYPLQTLSYGWEIVDENYLY